MYTKTIEIPIYTLDIIVCISSSFDDAIKKFKLDLELGAYNDSMGITFASDHTGKLEIYLILDPNYLDYEVILHELTHVTSYLCEHRGIKYDEGNDEPLAYFNGYAGGKVMKIIDDFKKKNISTILNK